MRLFQLAGARIPKSNISRCFSQAGTDVPIVDLTPFMEDPTSEASRIESEKVAHAFRHFGVVVIKDPRVDEKHNDQFVDMLEKYFEISDGKRDARPEHHYQVGVTPSNTEVPRDHSASMAKLKDKPLTPPTPIADPKWRFFWRIGPQPTETKYPSLNADPVIPEEFPEWASTMDMWGTKMLDALHTLAGMTAVGLNLPSNTIQDMMHCGPHLLAPTGSDFNTYDKVNTVLAGYHYDLNFMTIHGKSRYPGLYVWLRDGSRVPVKVPTGHLIVQVGKQFEYLTGGYIQAGFHEVVINEATAETIKTRKEEGKSLWRVSSTLFGHIASDQRLQPLGHFATEEALKMYPPIDTGMQVQAELESIALSQPQK
jgi:isopenicillin N synthase-like dioxygenase